VSGSTVSTNRKRKDAYEALSVSEKANYREGPTYTLKSTEESGLYGQRNYVVGEIISDETHNDYETTVSRMTEQPTGQAEVEEAYVALVDFGNTQAGNAVPKSEGDGNSTSLLQWFVPILSSWVMRSISSWVNWYRELMKTLPHWHRST
jgi:hypothetical protein